MRRLTQWIAATLVCGAMASVSAQTTVVTIRGPVVAVDPQRATIQIQDQSQGRIVMFQVPQEQPQVIIRQDGQQIELQDVQVGQIVEIRHDGSNMAQQIQILQTPTAPVVSVSTPAPSASITTSPASTSITTTPAASTSVTTTPAASTSVTTSPGVSVRATAPAAAVISAPASTTRIQAGGQTTQVIAPAAPASTRIEAGSTRIETDRRASEMRIQTASTPAGQVSVIDVHQWGPFDKLVRGVGNALFGFLEIPRQIFNTSQEDGLLAGLTAGVFKGVGYTVARMGTGAYETITFPIPLPEDYRPLMNPEFPWQEPSPGAGYLG